jgi:6-phosphogluconolactonase
VAVELRSFEDAEAMAEGLAGHVAKRLAQGIAMTGHASLVASGGTTPAPLYRALAGHDLDWDRIWVTGSDERWLPPDDPATLDHLLHTTLLQGPAAQARFVPLKTDERSPADAEGHVHAHLRDMPRPFDVVLLGLGLDGHTASLFPHAPGLATALDLDDPALARGIEAPASVVSPARMTLTLRAILDSRLIVLMFRGREKLEVFEQAKHADDPMAVPVAAVLDQDRVPVEAWWAP